jgi:hypothetical protein
MAVWLSALRTGCALPLGRFLVLISVRGCEDPKAILWLERLSQLEHRMTSPGIVTSTFRLPRRAVPLRASVTKCNTTRFVPSAASVQDSIDRSVSVHC